MLAARRWPPAVLLSLLHRATSLFWLRGNPSLQVSASPASPWRLEGFWPEANSQTFAFGWSKKV